MKKLTVIIFFLMSAVIVKAENEGLHFGLKICPSLAWLKTDTKGIESDGSKFGFSYGLITEFKFSDHYAFATGIDVNYRGGNMKMTTETSLGSVTTTSTIEQEITLQYIELPLTLKLKTNEIGYLTYYLQAGLAPGINIRARANSKSNLQTNDNGTITNSTSQSDNDDIKDGINNVNVSMLIGGGVEYTLSGSTVLLVGIQFNNGLLDVSDDSEIKTNSNTLGLAVGILF